MINLFNKYTHIYKGLTGISLSSAVVFASDLYPGCISETVLNRKHDFLDILDKSDTLMADHGFNIERFIAERSKALYFTFIKGNQQLSKSELIETRRIVEITIKQVKIFYII